MSLSARSEEQGHLCWYCKLHVPRGQRTIDHVVAQANGGDSSKFNTVMACAKCNTKKANKRTHRLKTLARLNVIRALAKLDPMTESDFA